MSKIPRWLLVLALGFILVFPMLSSFGLWDPQEIREADVAQDLLQSGSFADVTVGKKYSNRPVLSVWLVALSLKYFGISEFGGRLPFALCGLLAVMIGFFVLRKLICDRAGMIGAFVLITTPMFLFQSRQLISDTPYYASLVAAIGGLAAFLWPADGKRSRRYLALGGIGLVLGFLAKGLMLGTAFPLLAVLLAVFTSWSRTNGEDPDGIWATADGPDITPGMTVGAAFKKALTPLLITLLISGCLIAYFFMTLKGSKFMVLGAEYHKVATPLTFETTFKRLGFGLYPWFALLPIALALFVSGLRSRDTGGAETDLPRESRGAAVKMLLLVVAVGGYLLSSFWPGYFTQIRYPALPWLALAIGVMIHELSLREEVTFRVWGIIAAGMVLVLHQDFYMYPQSLAFSHVLTPPKFPIELNIKSAVRIFGLLQAVLFLLALGGIPAKIEMKSAVMRKLAWLPNLFGDGLRLIGGKQGKLYWVYAGAVALTFAGWCAFYLTPHLSLHKSNKALFQEFKKCRTGHEKLAQYQVSGRGAAYYNKGEVKAINNQNELFNLLREDQRWFILIPANHLGSINQAARQAQVKYFVLDERSSQYLLISNKLMGHCNSDRNPLLRYVLTKEPSPRKKLVANFENKVKLLGYDVKDVVTRGGKFKITLYFQVLGRMPSGYKIFLHFDQPANRFHGDHVPLGGKLATQYWLPGDFIVDTHEIEIPIITTPSGAYTIYMGFWLGSQRIKVVEGPNDGVNRVRLGTLRVR